LLTFDFEALVDRLVGNRALAPTVLDNSLGDMPQQLQPLAKLVAADNAAGAEDQAHRIRKS